MMFQFLQKLYNTFIDNQYYNLDKKIRINLIDKLNENITNKYDDKYTQTKNDEISYDNSENDFDEDNIQELPNNS